jgi:hypothetical protein
LQRVRSTLPPRNRRKIPAQAEAEDIQKLKIAWRLCYSRKPFREPCPRMRTPERGQLEAYTIGCQKPPRGFSGQPRHTVTCPRLDLLYQTAPSCARGESKKLSAVHRRSWGCGATGVSTVHGIVAGHPADEVYNPVTWKAANLIGNESA